jgi:hypothetical protein
VCCYSSGAAPNEERDLGKALVLVAVIGLTIVVGVVVSHRSAPPDIAKLEAQKDVPGLIEAAKRNDTRERAAAALGRLQDRRAVVPLTLLLGKVDGLKSHQARVAVVKALGKIGDQRAVKPLTRLLADPEAFVWEKGDTARALARIGDPRSVAAVLANESVPARLRADLVLMGRPAAPRLAAFIAGKLALPSTNPSLSRAAIQSARRSAAWALGCINNRPARARATAALTASLRTAQARWENAIYDGGDEVMHRESELLALVNRKDPAKLFPLLHRKDTYQAYWGVMRLRKRGTEAELMRALNELASDLGSSSPEVKYWVEDYLNRGSPALSAAAEKWALAHGMIVL